MINSNNKYTQMQLREYNNMAANWSENDRDWVVGTFDAHNNWEDYEWLFKNIQDQSEKIGLDFACGPGRNLVKYSKRFKRLDGVDISPINIEKAKLYTSNNNVECNLYVNNGVDLSIFEPNRYDFIMSVIALQHICVYEIRYSLFKDMYRILKPNGLIAIQMGFGSPSVNTVGYYENYYDAQFTNRGCDVCIESPDQLEKDLINIGFKNFEYNIGKVGPGDRHPNWIYFNAYK
jgi:ubiquinone/menaquinone biosynthesis C-methylase UbiE